MDRETPHPIHIAFSITMPSSNVCMIMLVGSVVEHPSIFVTAHVVIQPEETSRIDETNASVSSMEGHSTCFAHMGPYTSLPPSDNLAWAPNVTLSDDDMPRKRKNPIDSIIAGPMISSEYRSS